MKRNLWCLTLCLAMVVGFPALDLRAEDGIAIIEDIRIDLIKKAPEIKIASNVPIEYLDYTLEAPFRIIIDPLGIVYCNLDENIFSGRNMVKEVSIIKARGGVPRGLDRSYYPLDFIMIQLKKPVYYDVLREEKLVVKLGKEMIIAVPERPGLAEEVKVEITEVEPEDEVGGEVFVKEQAAAETGTEFFDEKKFPLIERYKIEPGDELEISVWQHPDLLRKVVVRPDGYVSFPLTGEINVNGLTTDRLAREITIRLSRVLRKPQVSVIVTSVGSKNIFVLGAVNTPGLYPYTAKLTVLRAVTAAGSWKPHAYLNSVLVVRNFFGKDPEVVRVNLWDVIKKGEVRQDISLQTGDIVYVPQSFIGNIGTFLDALRISFGTGTHYAIE